MLFSTGNISYQFEGFEGAFGKDQDSGLPKKSKILSWAAFQKMAKALEQDPNLEVRQKFGLEAKVTTSAPLKFINPFKPKPGINFPLEINGDLPVKRKR